VHLPATRTWFDRAASPPGILAVVMLAELILFTGYHFERWRKGLVPRNDPRLMTGEGFVIRCDGHGYYGWLRSLLVDGDWSFDNEFDEHNPLGDWVPPADQRTALGLRPNPWAVGPACLWSVFVVPAHGVFRALRPMCWPWTTDGYELPYQLVVGLTTLLASFAGLWLLYGICRHYARPVRAALAAALLTLGTTVVYYSSIEVSMAHGPGAAALAALVWYWLRTYGRDDLRRWLVVGILLGIAGLMRWQLVTFAVLPAGEFLLACRSRPSTYRAAAGLLVAILGAIAAFIPQLVAWHSVYGSWLPAPLATAHNWLCPSLWQVLASSDRSLFYWTPIALLAFVGLALGWNCGGSPERHRAADSRRQPAALLLSAFVLQVYLVASLWGEQVYLGAAFGLRHFTESVVALAPGLAMLLERATARRYGLLCSLCCLLVLWNLLLVCQYRYRLVPAAGGA